MIKVPQESFFFLWLYYDAKYVCAGKFLCPRNNQSENQLLLRKKFDLLWNGHQITSLILMAYSLTIEKVSCLFYYL
jgi:hypothetical protein